MSDGTLKVNVTAPPQRGKANEEVREVLARHFGVGVGDVEIVSGHGSPRKLVRIAMSVPEPLSETKSKLETDVTSIPARSSVRDVSWETT